jgi:hypothetical protein
MTASRWRMTINASGPEPTTESAPAWSPQRGDSVEGVRGGSKPARVSTLGLGPITDGSITLEQGVSTMAARIELHRSASLSPEILPETLTSAQGIALASLLAGKTMTTAARAAGVNRSTVWRWLHNDPEFIAFYNSARVEMSLSVQQSLRLISAQAVVTLRRLMTRKSVPDATKLAAAQAVLKVTSAPVEGPTDVDEAKSEIVFRGKKREQAVWRSLVGVSDAELQKHLERPISKRQDVPEDLDDEDDLEEEGDDIDDDDDDIDDENDDLDDDDLEAEDLDDDE